MITLHNLTKEYGQTTILDQANYQFPEKGFICLLGESGSGKSTLVNLIAGFDTDYTGEIIVDDTPLNSLSEAQLGNYRKDYIGFVFQNYHLLSGYTVLENILLPCELTSTNQAESKAYARKLLADLGIAEKENEQVQNLSGGQKQRVAIARALIQKPKMVIADEPTGALDRKTATEMMDILKEISQTKLVILITHDTQLCEIADEVIQIIDNKLVIQQPGLTIENSPAKKMMLQPPKKINLFKMAAKNFRVRFLSYFFISLVFSIGILSFITTLSSGQLMTHAIQQFKEKNTSFNNGYISYQEDDNSYQILSADQRVENVYKQYKIQQVTLSSDDFSMTMPEKYPMPKTTESMSYGTMPRIQKNEIAITPSLAKKLNPQIDQLIGKSLTVTYQGKEYPLTISGIYNAGYDDFFVSSDIEQDFYQGIDSQSYEAIHYDVKKFEDIVPVTEELAEKNIQTKTAVTEVKALQKSFKQLKTLFTLISMIILLIALFIVIMMLLKLQQTRYHMVGLLYSFGFNQKNVKKLLFIENLCLAMMTAGFTSLLLLGLQLIAQLTKIDFRITLNEWFLTISASVLIILVTHLVTSYRLFKVQPIVALKK
ncbi:ABC transporter ATP-binding protein/permease [Isobaculum melis]|uniref:ABC-type lipoprotein export system, ATPase component n=1 Tax=Isobaculum melis TaxID=142588 RepID=A0A1H9SFJ8_9LACT|nr:ABC transporter ATP-binding protein [Isobaculum melis]SER83782.1 ABC-type lipoprotein export system, ATPase component [Isobaculum melis]